MPASDSGANHDSGEEFVCLGQEAIKKRLHKAARAELEEQLLDDECPVVIIEGNSAQAMIVTNRHRVLVFKKGWMSGVAFGRKMYAWNFSEIQGIRVDVRLMNGFVALETTGSDVENISYWGSEGGDAWKAGNAIPLAKVDQAQARDGAAALRKMLHRYHNPEEVRSRIATPSTNPVPGYQAGLRPVGATDETSSQNIKRFCFACGTKLQIGAAFCSACGQQVT